MINLYNYFTFLLRVQFIEKGVKIFFHYSALLYIHAQMERLIIGKKFTFFFVLVYLSMFFSSEKNGDVNKDNFFSIIWYNLLKFLYNECHFPFK